MSRRFEYFWSNSLKQLERQIKLQPLNLGGTTSSGGGAGGPPGGFTGVLPQTRVAYDTSELESLVTPSGATLLDNLNHIRYRIAQAENKTQQGAFTVLGALEVATNPIKMVNHYGATKTISGVYLDIDVPPSGSDVIVDIHNEGTTIFTNQGNRPRILDGEYNGFSVSVDSNVWLTGEALKAAVDQVGSGVAGSDLTITVVYY